MTNRMQLTVLVALVIGGVGCDGLVQGGSAGAVAGQDTASKPDGVSSDTTHDEDVASQPIEEGTPQQDGGEDDKLGESANIATNQLDPLGGDHGGTTALCLRWPTPGTMVTQGSHGSRKAIDIDCAVDDPLINPFPAPAMVTQVVDQYTGRKCYSSLAAQQAECEALNACNNKINLKTTIGGVECEASILHIGQSSAQVGDVFDAFAPLETTCSNVGWTCSAGGDGSHAHMTVMCDGDYIYPGSLFDLDCPAAVGRTCSDDRAGDILSPNDGETVSSAGFTVAAQAYAADGLARMTIAVDTRPDCKFSRALTSEPSSVTENIAVSLAQCQIFSGEHTLGLWTRDACGDAYLLDSIKVVVAPPGPTCPGGCGACRECTAAGCAASPNADGQPCGTDAICVDGECVIQRPPTCAPCGTCETCDPSTGECAPLPSGASCGPNASGLCQSGTCMWIEVANGIGAPTQTPPPNTTDCTCTAEAPSCHALWVGTVTSIEGNVASVHVAKPDGAGPSEPVSFWLVVQEEQYPRCSLNDIYHVRESGNWPAEQPLVTTMRVWPSTNEFLGAPCNAEKRGHALSGGGGGHNHDKIWQQYESWLFTKRCQ